MTKLKFRHLEDDKAVKVTHELSASIYRNLVAYADILSHESGQKISDPSKRRPIRSVGPAALPVPSAGPNQWIELPTTDSDIARIYHLKWRCVVGRRPYR
jgi:Protein of unknown function (DUF2274)